MDDDFHSLNKGVFVIPFQPDDTVAGPSKPRPLGKVYDHAYHRYETAYKKYEADRSVEQLDEIAEWLERCDSPPMLNRAFPIQRLPLAIIQSLSPSIVPRLTSLVPNAVTVNGRDMSDLASATRAVAVGFLGEAALASRKAGRTPIDEVERWWRGLHDQPPLLLHIQQAQLVSTAVLSKIMYIFNLHADIPIRLLVSVPSINIFMSTWTMVEPSEVDLSILSSGRTRKRSAGVHAILKAASDYQEVPIAITDELAEELGGEEELLGGGAAGTLKSLKWLLLHHSYTSPLASIADDESSDSLRKVQALVDEIKEGHNGSGTHLFTMDTNADLISVQNPTPRLSILQALSKPSTFLPTTSPAIGDLHGHENGAEADGADPNRTSPLTSRKSGSATPKDDDAVVGGQRRSDVAEMADCNGEPAASRPSNDLSSGSEAFKAVEALYALWQSGGKSVNLWDWLEGFRAAVDDEDDDDEDDGDVSGAYGADEDTTPQRGKRKRRADEENGRDPEEEAEKQARQHATFIRFVEESRMLGLVRARGSRTSKRADEVVKGVLMI